MRTLIIAQVSFDALLIARWSLLVAVQSVHHVERVISASQPLSVSTDRAYDTSR
jgi:hypothetical protein